MGHGNGIKWYAHLELLGDGPAAAHACLAADPPRPPGSAAEFYDAAAQLGRRAQTLRDALGKLASIAATEGVWTGSAAESFRSVLRDAHRSHYDQVPQRYDGYAAALRAYAAALPGHQASIDSARADVQAALTAHQRVQLAASDHPYALAVGTDRAGQLCQAASVRFRAAYNDWVDAVAQCERAIEKVDDDRLHNAHGAQVATDVIGGVAGELSSLTAVLAVLTLPFPVLSEALLVLSTASSLVALGADSTRRFAYGEDIDWRRLSLDALGAIPMIKPVEVGARAGRAAKEAGVLGRLGAGAKTFGRTFGHEVADAYVHGPARAVSNLKEAGFRGTFARPSLTRSMESLKGWEKQDLLQYPASWASDAYDHRRQGWAKAARSSAFRVTWQPLGPVVPAVRHGAARVGSAIAPALPDGRP
jgi:uncharacterized protein YukE